MGVKSILYLVLLVVMISGCSGDKTKAVVTDLNGDSQEELQEDVAPDEDIEASEDVEEDEETVEQETEDDLEEEDETEDPDGPKTWDVSIVELRLDPADLLIKPGDTVKWEHKTPNWGDEDIVQIQLVSHQNEFRAPSITIGETYSYTFENPGVFTYIDLFHKGRELMRGTIIVSE